MTPGILLTLALLAGPAAEVTEPSGYERFAGEDRTFVTYTRIHHWQVIGAHEIVVRMRDEAYLIELGGVCTAHDLREAKLLKLPSRARVRHLERTGVLVVDDLRCTILRIRDFDYAAYQEGGT